MRAFNELLYHRLRETFGDVRIANDGAPAQIHYRPDWLYREGRLKAEVVSNGETYYVNCPFCTDTRKRLAICHLWAVRDKRTGDDMLHLAHCFNDNCINTREVQKELHAMIFPKGCHARYTKVRAKPTKTTAPTSSATIQLPLHTALTSLPKNHPAISYLVKRHFDPAALAAQWGVCFCPANFTIKPHFATGRIVVPVYALRMSLFGAKDAAARRVLAGWQARTLDPRPPKRIPKYLTAAGMAKSRLLYGLPQAVKADGPVVVVEGVTDVWRVGPGGVGLFGKSISPAQTKLILRHFHGRPIVVLLDSDATEEAKRVCGQIRQARLPADSAPVVVGKLPANRKDPGECSAAELKKIVRSCVR